MTPAEIGKKLHDLVKNNSHDFSPYYSEHESDFLEWFKSFEGYKTDIRVNMAESQSLEKIKFATLMSDFTSIFPYHPSKFLYTWDHFDPLFRARKIVFGGKSIYKRGESELHAGYGSVSDEVLEQVFDELSPLIDAGKVMIRPEKAIFSLDLRKETLVTGIFLANPNYAEKWEFIDGIAEQDSHPVTDKISEFNMNQQVSELLIPFISGVSVSDFAKILIDEEDILSSFRAQIKIYLEQIRKGDINASEFREDVIRPKIDTIGRKFKHVANMHKIEIAGASLATVGLSLLSFTQTGLAGALSQIVGIGLGSTGFLKSETEYQAEIEKLKDVPEYLLWRINQLKTRG